MLNNGAFSWMISMFFTLIWLVMKKYVFLLPLLFLGACIQTPFVDSRREAGSAYAVGESTPDRVAICYNPYSTNADEIMKMAQSACQETNREPAYDGHNYWSCRLFLPHRVYYRCQNVPDDEKK